MDCPKCGGPVWDNIEANDVRLKNGEKLRPDYSCKDKDGCGWLQWRPKDGGKKILVQTNKPIHNSSSIDLGKKENNQLICRTDLMCALIAKHSETTLINEIVNMHRELWSELVNPMGKI